MLNEEISTEASRELGGEVISLVKNRRQEKLLEEMRGNLPLRLLYLAPEFPQISQTIKSYSDFVGMSKEEVLEAVDGFLMAGLWRQSDDGRIHLASQNIVRLGQSEIGQHLSSTLSLIDHLTKEGPCWYESVVFATTQELKKQFYLTVYKAMQELVQKITATGT